ncbi:MAG: ferrous iron transport protein B [Anaerolineales bacterium]
MSCHTPATTASRSGAIALVGHPNVGKSALFHQLTGQRVIVSNYPGTTVEVSRSPARDMPETTLVDTPGVVTFPAISEDELVTARVLLEEPLQAVLQVGDAKNLARTLYLTVQLAELGLPLVLALNMSDEAQARGLEIDTAALHNWLDTDVIPTTAVRGQGVAELQHALRTAHAPHFRLEYPPAVETALAQLVQHLPQAAISARALALMWLSGDPQCERWLCTSLASDSYAQIETIKATAAAQFEQPLRDLLQQTRSQAVERLLPGVLTQKTAHAPSLLARLSPYTTHRFWGLVILVGVLVFLFWFVGMFGAGTLVGLLEENLFAGIINPWVTNLVQTVIPWPFVQDMLVGPYGLWTMGLTYALALILPIVSTFFLAFGVLEDSGYLPRLAALSNRAFQRLGLNGKAVLPMVLGLGCVTMATLTTRVLETRRERLLTILLLALAVPCSAQLGVVMGMLAGISLGATLIWTAVVLGVFLVVGWLAARLLPGERSTLLVELPPLRLPVFSNVLVKTLARLEWYLKEVVPLFLIGTFVMFILDRTGILAWLIEISRPVVTGWLGLPPQASAAFLMGFMRRDFGATGLFVLASQGLMNPAQVVTAMVTITLFIPCVASVMMIGKESNWRTALSITLVIFPLAVLVGGLLYRGLLLVGWGI